MLKEYEQGPEAFEKLGQTMNRLELDAGKKPDELWCYVIAMRFSDNAFRPSFNLDNLYPWIDPSRPLPVPRHGSFLKENLD